MTGQTIVGLRYSGSAVRRHPARNFGCALCPRRAMVWDHCHEHGIVRGALCGRCNRRMCNVDAGICDPDWPGAFPLSWELCRHGWTVGRVSESRQHVWTADDLLGLGTRRSGRELLAYRAGCNQCNRTAPPVAQWVREADARTDLASRLVIEQWHPPCAWCPVTQAVHGVTINPKYPAGVRQGWRERQRGQWAPWTPRGSPERAESARMAARDAAGRHRGVAPRHALPA